MSCFKIFIVEDDAWYGKLLHYHLSLNHDYEVTLFSTAKDCLDNLHKRPDAITIDFDLPDISGQELLLKIKAQNSAIPVVIISGQEDISTALGLLKQGAHEYIIKDNNTKDVLWNTIIRIRENTSLKQAVVELQEQLETKFDFEKTIIGKSPAIRKCFTLIEKAIKSNINVSITGETGTGKEVVAKAIHFNSDRKKKPFIAINMAAIPRELIESELFGHEKGAFTGATARKLGKFEEAQGGTIFLDEIGEMDLNLQSKLLRVLQERELVRVGGSESVKIDVRLLIATHKNLSEEVKKGNFREDLYYRMIGLPIELPPLRERGNDILILAKYFADGYAKDNKTKAFTFSQEAKEKLQMYNFPGNVRELKSIIDLACVMAESQEITANDITYTAVKSDEVFTAIEKSMSDYQVDIICFFLKKYNNNVVHVAKKLGIGKSTIYNMIKAGIITT
jgi:two-component system, NtrC family, response regulator AtoC